MTSDGTAHGKALRRKRRRVEHLGGPQGRPRHRILPSGKMHNLEALPAPMPIPTRAADLVWPAGDFLLVDGIYSLRAGNRGGPVTDCQISPVLPGGLSISVDTSGSTMFGFGNTSCSISGKPTAPAAVREYRVIAGSAGGDSTSALQLSVRP